MTVGIPSIDFRSLSAIAQAAALPHQTKRVRTMKREIGLAGGKRAPFGDLRKSLTEIPLTKLGLRFERIA